MVKISLKYGGSGGTKTKFLESVQETIIRGRSAHTTVTIDSNLIMELINEVLKHRAEKFEVEEFTLSSSILTSSCMYRNDSEPEEITEADLDDTELEVREIPVIEKIPKTKKGRFKTKVTSKDYWLAGSNARSVIIGVLGVLITIILLVFLV
jgi:hypothetical protein